MTKKLSNKWPQESHRPSHQAPWMSGRKWRENFASLLSQQLFDRRVQGVWLAPAVFLPTVWGWIRRKLLYTLRYTRMCLHLFANFEAYHEQMDPISSSSESLDSAPGDTYFRLSTQQNCPRDSKLTQSCSWLHWFLRLCADVCKNLFQVHTGLAVAQVWIEKLCNESI